MKRVHKIHPSVGSSFFSWPSLGFYTVLGLLVFAPCLFLGNAYFDGDLYAQYIPMWTYLKSCITQGQFPLWCPYFFGGQPFFADPNAMAAYPLTYLTLPLPVPYGFGVFYFLHFLLAAWGMHAWLKTLGLSEGSARVGALLYVFSGFFWWEIIHPALLAAFAWMPWWGMSLEKVSEKLNPFRAFVAGFFFALLFLAGNFQMTLGAIYGGGIYLFFRLLTREEWGRGPRKDSQPLLSPVFFLWGALPLLALWIPASEFLNLSERLHAHLDYETFQADYSLNPSKLLQFLFPVEPFTKKTVGARPLDDYLANAGYLGPWALFLMGLAFQRPRKKFAYFIAAMGAAALLLAFGKFFPLHRLACFWVPGIGLTRAPFRYVFLYVTAGSVLAALGYETLKELLEKGKKKKSAVFPIGAGIYGLVIALLALGQGARAWVQWLALALGFLSFWYMWRKARPPWAAWFFPLTLVLCLLPTAWTTCTSRWGPSSNFNWTSNCPILSPLREKTGLARVFIGDNIPYPIQSGGQQLQMPLPADVALATGIRNVAGYDPLYLAKAFELYSLPAPTFMRLLAVKAFVTGDDRWHLQGFSCEDWGNIKFCRNQEPVSFAYAPGQVRSISDDKDRLAAMRRDDFNPHEVSYFSEPLPDPMKGDVGKSSLRYELVRDDPDEELFKVTRDQAGWVVFSEVMYPGWKAWVDGKPSALFTANHVFRAVWVPAGGHEVLFRYEPAWWKPLLLGLALWLLSALTLAFGPWGKGFFKELRADNLLK